MTESRRVQIKKNSAANRRKLEREREREQKSLRNDETLELVHLHGCASQNAVAILSPYIALLARDALAGEVTVKRVLVKGQRVMS